MTLFHAVSAELRKAATLPAVWAGAAVAILGSLGITLLNAVTARSAIAAGRADELLASTSAFETGYAAAPLGTVGAVVIGVVLISSEYTANSPDAGGGRQLTTTLTVIPRRLTVLTAKAVAVVAVVAVAALVALPACLVLARAVIGDAGHETVSAQEALWRWLGACLYWTLTGLLAFAIAVLTRSGVVPLIVLIVNSSLVSVSLLLTNITPLAHWLPDMAGRRLFGGVDTIDGGLDTLPGALVMAAWTVGLLAVAGAAFTRRDA
ncbi:ABC transporter permease [Microbacterium marinilacus]|uniref:ABC transporter permease n=1 Tax=Microbacterium marinilacus TaxID=415209 RepID=A0ABP7BJT5_9MICO|nr:ABC transporter permease [Microbacterium marinilacus]MBY0687638.1 ABC transporter permease [Microbacterium marinilacus]